MRTIDNSAEWIDRIRAACGHGMAFLLNLGAMEENPRDRDYANRAALNKYLQSIQGNSAYDIVLVDGVDGDISFRVDCVKKAIEHVRSNGFIVLDDAWPTEHFQVSSILCRFERMEFLGLRPSRWGVTKTDIYRRP